jgi:homogentisate solanesyltransferase
MKKLIAKTVDCFFLLRIPLLVPVWTVLILGWITGSSSAVPGGWIFRTDINFAQERILWIALVSFSFIVASIYVVNQIADIESDRINHKLFILPRGLLSVKTAWVCAILCALLGLGGGIFLLDIVMVLLFIAGLILGILYNLPPVRLKNRAWGGVIANFIGHGVITYLVGWYAANSNSDLNIATCNRGLIASLTAGFANAAVFLTTTIPDAAGDKSTGKRTFCVAYGERNTALAAAVSCALALVCAFTLEHNGWVMIIPSTLSLLLFVYFVISAKQEFAFKTFRWPVILLSTFVVFFIPLYGGIIIVTLVVSRLYYKIRFNFDYPTFKNK